MMRILYDTDFLLGAFAQDDAHYTNVRPLLNKIGIHEMFALRLVHYELATVLSRKFKQSLTIAILDEVKKLPIHWLSIDEVIEEKIWQEFYSYKKKNVSFVDCANLAFALDMNMKIASFDRFYPKDILLQ